MSNVIQCEPTTCQRHLSHVHQTARQSPAFALSLATPNLTVCDVTTVAAAEF